MVKARTPETARGQAACSIVNDPRWARVLKRDRTADGFFWYSVATTGVYCRPSCPSRAANPINVQLHDTLADAKTTGFRPCKRCHPDGPSTDAENVAIVARACRLIEESEGEDSLNALATAVGLSASYFHRRFKAVTGLTPKDYAAAHRAGKIRDGLANGASVTEAIYGAGFNSSGRFYEKSTSILGMTPTQFKTGGANEEIRFALGETSLGAILVASSKKGVASILLGDDPDALLRQLQDRFPKASLIGADREYEALVDQVVGFVARLMSAARPSNVACGRRCRKSRSAKRFLTRKSRNGSVRPGLCVPLRAPARPMTSQSLYPVIGWSGTTEPCPGTRGA